MQTDHARAQIKEGLDLLEEEAYRRGWDDAIKHVMSAASQASAKAKDSIAQPTRVQREAHKATYGVVTPISKEALNANAETGVTPAEVVRYGRIHHQEEIAESSARRALAKFVEQGSARKGKGRWFPVQPSTGAGPEKAEAEELEPRSASADPFAELLE